MAIRPRLRERSAARRNWVTSGAARRPSASAKSRWPSRQAAQYALYLLVVAETEGIDTGVPLAAVV